MAVRFQIDSVDFPMDPVVKRFERDKIFERGDRREGFSGYLNLECEFPHLTYAQYQYFTDKWYAQAFHTLRAPSRDFSTMQNYTGTVIRSVAGEERDVEGFVFNVRVSFEIPT